MTLTEGDLPTWTNPAHGDAVPRLDPDESDEIEPQAARIVGASTDAVKDYMRQLSRVPLLTADEEVTLARRIEVGVLAQDRLDTGGGDLDDELRRDLAWLVRDGAEAKHRFITANLRLVVKIAKHYTGRGLPLLDLIQEGNIGLVRAVEKFDFAAGFKFSTYGSWWIRQSITRGTADQSRMIRIPVHTVELIDKIARREHELRTQSNREPTLDEIAAAVDMPAQKVKELRDHGRTPISLQLALNEDGDGELGDLIEDGDTARPDDLAAIAMLNRHVAALLDSLTPRQREILTLRYGLNGAQTRTYEQIGMLYGVTRERIRQLETKTIAHLRDRADREFLES